ncbi:MAG: ABC transporter permease [Myxococcales bacterium]|nr:MAG: ABC transporter permease [Myxococcales bacterium]
MMIAFTVVLALFAAAIAFGVVYNNARISLAQRSRDLATLRVLGFRRREVASVLIGELVVHVTLAIIPGVLFGLWLSKLIADAVDPENFRLPVIVSAQTYAFSVGIVILSALLSAWLVRRRVNNLDLIGVLKTRE